MISIISKVLDIITSITAKDLLYMLIIGLLGWMIYTQHISYNTIQDRYEHNVKAFTDTVSYYKSEAEHLIAVKSAFECDIKELEKLNTTLHDEIKDLKSKNKILTGMYVNGKIENPSVDTVYIVNHDTIQNGFNRNFNFNNKWRTLEGIVSYVPDSLKVNILKDEINFDYTVAVDDENKLYIKSSNPYIKYNSFTGYTVTSCKKNPFEWNIYGEFQYNFNLNNASPILGTEVSYKGINGFYEFDIINRHHIIGLGYKHTIFNF